MKNIKNLLRIFDSKYRKTEEIFVKNLENFLENLKHFLENF